MPLPESFLQDLLSRNDIEDVVGSYVNMRRRGRNLVGLCPFHGEKTPSFTLYPETASFYCFGCGAGGDVITFIKRIENLDYLDAVKFLADRVGMAMPEGERVNDVASRLRVRVLEANREAARLFHGWLYSPEGAQALDYYRRRGYTDRTIRHFGLGWAPNDYHKLRDALRDKGFRDEELEAAFLTKRGQRGGYYDVFRGRVMIPIIDIRGNVIGFGGRVLDDSKPKYVNTSDTPAFKKTNNLFALNFAKAAGGRTLILCEGYMDVIAMHQAGFTNAVAALGTSFTEEHANLLARYADEVVLVFDADEAGQKATRRTIGILRKTGIDIRVVRVPDGKDPDEYIRKHGSGGFQLLLERSANDVEYRLIELGKLHDLSTASGRVKYLQEATALLAALPSPVERDVYAGKLAEDLSVTKQSILQQVAQFAARRTRQQQKRELSQAVRDAENTVRKVNPDATRYPRAVHAEEGLIGLLFLHPDFILSVGERLPPDSLATAFNQTLYRRMLERKQQGLMVEISLFSEQYDSDEMGYISRMVQQARNRENSLEEAMRYADVLLEEAGLRNMQSPQDMTDDQIRDMLERLRQRKQ